MKDDSYIVLMVLDNLLVGWINSIQRRRQLGKPILLGTGEVGKSINQEVDALEQTHYEVQQPP